MSTGTRTVAITKVAIVTTVDGVAGPVLPARKLK
jgi:hypothetical protein